MPDQPGWYPDPSQPDVARWFDGGRWTTHVRRGTPPPSPTGSGVPPQAAQVPGWAAPQTAPPAHLVGSRGNVVTRSPVSLLSALVAIVYVVVLLQGDVFIFGLLPLGLAVAGYKLHEPLAVPALVVGGLAFVANIYASIH